MDNQDRVIQFEVLNERFTIKSKVPKEYYLRLVKILNGKITKIKERVPNLSNGKLLTFAALDLADELVKARENSLGESEVKLLNELSESLASVIEETDE
jgi:cell division protein ZapA (FtsZ GTPase activity inhibitor)